MSLFKEKFIICSSIALLNILLSVLFIIYEDKWYAFLPFLAFSPLLSSINSILLWGKNMLYGKDFSKFYRDTVSSYVYVVPCYNESEKEITDTLDSLTTQVLTDKDKKVIFIVCDGKIKGRGNYKSTDRILIEDILVKNISNKIKFNSAYTTWDTNTNDLDLYNGFYNNIPFLLFIKNKNYGKRDGLVLIRRLLYLYNQKIDMNLMISDELLHFVKSYLAIYFDDIVEYIIGTDADTVFERNCTNELIKKIESNRKTVGCVGFVNISHECYQFSPFTLYQNAEYIYAQCLKRQQQSELTHKVNCLSGCVQILKVCGETCGDNILSRFNFKPPESANIFDQIRSYASEDRNHVCLMLSEFPYVETTQSLYANAFTKIPMNFEVLFSQRRRWNLGATTNDLLLLTSPNILFYERLSALANILTFVLAPFILVATAVFIKTIIEYPSMLMLYLSIIIMIPFFYSITIPLFVKRMTFREGMYYVMSYLFYVLTNSFMNIILYTYAILQMDRLTWGKTRQVEKNKEILIKTDKNTQTDFILNIEEIDYNDFIFNNKEQETSV